MDLKALIAKMDQIESKQLLNEGFPTVADAKTRADKEKTTGKFDKKELSTGTQYTRKSNTFTDGGDDSDTKKAKKKAKANESFSFKPGGIAHHLLNEFGLAEKVTLPADGSTPATVTKNGVTMNAPAAPAIANPYTGADAAKFAAMSPEDQAWLTKGGGKPDINDAAILARTPNKGKPAPQKMDPNQADRDDAEMGAAGRAMAAGGNSTSAATGVGNPGEEAAAQAAADKPAATGSFDSFGTPVAAGSAAATSADPTGLAQAQQDVNAGKPGAPAAPAAGKTEWPADKAAIIAFQKANKLVPDGLIGGKTMAALQAAGATPPAGFKPVGNKAAAPAAGQAAQPAASLGGKSFKDASAAANAVTPSSNPEANQTAAVAARTGVAGTAAAGGGRGGQGGPTAAQAAQAGDPAVARIDTEIKRFSAKNDMTNVINQNYVKNLEAKKAKLGGGQAAQPAAAAPAAAQPGALGSGTYQAQSVRNEDDAILERIRTALFR